MNDKKTNELKEKEAQVIDNWIPSDKELENKTDPDRQINLKKNERLNTNSNCWDLSGGLLGI